MIQFRELTFQDLCDHKKRILPLPHKPPESVQSTTQPAYNTHTHSTLGLYVVRSHPATQSPEKHLRSDTNSTSGPRQWQHRFWKKRSSRSLLVFQKS